MNLLTSCEGGISQKGGGGKERFKMGGGMGAQKDETGKQRVISKRSKGESKRCW